MNRTESAIEAYLNHYKRIAIIDMIEFFGLEKGRQGQQDLNARWNSVFSKHGFNEFGKKKIVEIYNILYHNEKVRKILT